jgi:uncharacterized protein (TIGR00369 family)
MNIKEINQFCQNTMVSHLGIEFIESSGNTVVARMPVSSNTRQPMGYLHGGASLALSETVGSAGSLFLVDVDKFDVFGMQVTANHVSPVREGDVIATATLIHRGRTSHIWNVEIKDEQGRLISIARVTNAIVEKK